jgi:type IV pilus biogenesis protein CpaD/CtpE
MSRWTSIALLLLAAGLAGCASNPPALTPAGDKVQLAASAAEVQGCTLVEKTYLSGTDLRGDVEAQQRIKARNLAAEKGANRVLPIGASDNLLHLGQQGFELYRCP